MSVISRDYMHGIVRRSLGLSPDTFLYDDTFPEGAYCSDLEPGEELVFFFKKSSDTYTIITNCRILSYFKEKFCELRLSQISDQYMTLDEDNVEVGNEQKNYASTIYIPSINCKVWIGEDYYSYLHCLHQANKIKIRGRY